MAEFAKHKRRSKLPCSHFILRLTTGFLDSFEYNEGMLRHENFHWPMPSKGCRKLPFCIRRTINFIWPYNVVKIQRTVLLRCSV
jgi:hypothetical protein